MNRQYGNPWDLEGKLEAAERVLSDAIARGETAERLADLFEEVDELRERMNCAWQELIAERTIERALQESDEAEVSELIDDYIGGDC